MNKLVTHPVNRLINQPINKQVYGSVRLLDEGYSMNKMTILQKIMKNEAPYCIGQTRKAASRQ